MGTRNVDLGARHRDGVIEVESESAFCSMNICEIRDSLCFLLNFYSSSFQLTLFLHFSFFSHSQEQK